MLQFRELDEAHCEEAGPTGPLSGDDLERLVDRRVARLREDRARRARAQGLVTRARETLDRLVRTDTVERLDRSNVSDTRKLRIVRDLDRFNRMLFSYHRFFAAIEPFVRRVSAREGRPARVLELAAGAGEFTLHCADLARRKGLAVEVTGTDIVEAYVDAGNRNAAERGVDARFRQMNAFDLSSVAPGSYDIAFIAQSLHHFSPGQIGRMIAQSRHVCTTGFVGIDGRRSLLLLSTVPGMSLVLGSLDFAHDALLSTRKFYSDSELHLIARTALPRESVAVRASHPGFSIVTVDFSP